MAHLSDSGPSPSPLLLITVINRLGLAFIVLLNNFFSHFWDAETGENDCFTGKGHTNQVSKMAVNDNDELATCSMDDTLRFTHLSKKEYRYLPLWDNTAALRFCSAQVGWSILTTVPVGFQCQ